MHRPFIQTFWGPRPETREQCAARWSHLFENLAPFPEFSKWFFQGRSAKSSRRPVPLGGDALERALETNNNDTDGSPIVELGFSLSMWNGLPEVAASSLSATCGTFLPRIKNRAGMQLPNIEVLEKKRLATYSQLLKAIVDSFDPDEAVVTSTELMSQSEGRSWIKSGWITYEKGGDIVVREDFIARTKQMEKSE